MTPAIVLSLIVDSCLSVKADGSKKFSYQKRSPCRSFFWEILLNYKNKVITLSNCLSIIQLNVGPKKAPGKGLSASPPTKKSMSSTCGYIEVNSNGDSGRKTSCNSVKDVGRLNPHNFLQEVKLED